MSHMTWDCLNLRTLPVITEVPQNVHGRVPIPEYQSSVDQASLSCAMKSFLETNYKSMRCLYMFPCSEHLWGHELVSPQLCWQPRGWFRQWVNSSLGSPKHTCLSYHRTHLTHLNPKSYRGGKPGQNQCLNPAVITSCSDMHVPYICGHASPQQLLAGYLQVQRWGREHVGEPMCAEISQLLASPTVLSNHAAIFKDVWSWGVKRKILVLSGFLPGKF